MGVHRPSYAVGAPSVSFAEHEGPFLVGAAAALTSETGTIGFIGGLPVRRHRTLPGRLRSRRPCRGSIGRVLAMYSGARQRPASSARTSSAQARQTCTSRAPTSCSTPPATPAPASSSAARESSSDAGPPCLGHRCRRRSVPRRQHTGTTARPHVDGQALRRRRVRDDPRPPRRRPRADRAGELTLADGGVGYSTTGGHLTPETIATLEELEAEVVVRRAGRAPLAERAPAAANGRHASAGSCSP